MHRTDVSQHLCVTVDVEMLAEELLSGTRRQCGAARVELVAVDNDGQATPIQ